MNDSLPHLVYDLPIVMVALLVIGGSLLATLLLLLIFHRLLPVDLRSAHNDVAGFTIAIVGVIYAVLLAFIAVSASCARRGVGEHLPALVSGFPPSSASQESGLPPPRISRSLISKKRESCPRRAKSWRLFSERASERRAPESRTAFRSSPEVTEPLPIFSRSDIHSSLESSSQRVDRTEAGFSRNILNRLFRFLQSSSSRFYPYLLQESGRRNPGIAPEPA